MKKVDGNEVGIWEGFAYIICGNKGKTICKVAHGDKTDTFLTLNDCLKEIGYDCIDYEVCIVIFESPLLGKVYQYGNYGEYWCEHGTTKCFA